MNLRKSLLNTKIVEDVLIVKTFLTEKERIEILNCIENDSSIELSKNISDNLLNTDRTNWDYHKNKNFKKIYDGMIYGILHDAMELFVLRDLHSYDALSYIKYGIFTTDCWFAKSNNNSIVQPHVHGSLFGLFSFSCYLKLPSSRTSLSFSNKHNNVGVDVEIKEGDILIFPSHITHWTTDVEEGRSILAGNLVLTIQIKEERLKYDLEQNA
jgi:hypothetical protein